MLARSHVHCCVYAQYRATPILINCQVPVYECNMIVVSHAHLSTNVHCARLNALSGHHHSFIHPESLTVNKFVCPLPRNFRPSNLSLYAVHVFMCIRIHDGYGLNHIIDALVKSVKNILVRACAVKYFICQIVCEDVHILNFLYWNRGEKRLSMM